MNLFRFSIFQKILVAMLLVALVPLGVIWYINYSDATKRISGTVEQQLTDVSNNLVSFVDNWVMMHYRILKQTAAIPDIMSMNGAKQKPILKSIIGEYDWIYGVITLGPDGMNVGRYDDKKLEDYSDRIYFKQIAGGAPIGMQVAISKSTGKPNFTLAAPILKTTDGSPADPNNFAGVLVMAMQITHISDIITKVRVGKTAYAFLLDENGKIIAHQNEEFSKIADFSKHPVYVNRPTQGVKQLNYDDNGKKVIAYAQPTKYGWTMVVQQDADEAFQPIRDANKKALLLLLVTVLVVTAIAYGFSQQLATPIRNLTRIADEMSRGRAVVKINEVRRGDEIGTLAAAIDRMGTSIRLAIERLSAKPNRTADPNPGRTADRQA